MITERLRRFLGRQRADALTRDMPSPEELSRTPCSAYGCASPRSTEVWMHGCCADLRTRGQWAPICTECDIKLNEHSLRFFFGSARDEDLAGYVKYIRHRDALTTVTEGGADGR